MAEHESNRNAPWSVADAPADYIDAMLGAIVGIEISVAELVGKWKLSQNRNERDREGVLRGLARERPQGMGFVEAMRLHASRDEDA